MRDKITFNSSIKAWGKSFCIPIQKKEVDILGIDPGDDLEITVTVMERQERKED